MSDPLNERLNNEPLYPPIDRRSNGVRDDLYPERRGIWDQTVVWIPRTGCGNPQEDLG